MTPDFRLESLTEKAACIEKTPSLAIHRGGSATCYGCGKQTTIEEIKDQLHDRQ